MGNYSSNPSPVFFFGLPRGEGRGEGGRRKGRRKWRLVRLFGVGWKGA